MNFPTFLSILKNFIKGLNDSQSSKEGVISYKDKGSGSHTVDINYLISNLFSFIRESNVYSKSGEKTRLDKYVKNKFYEKLGIQTSSNNKIEDDKVKITFGSDTKINN
tara:strand:+ start:110 stop:433 length:324 start_codon:yes stop_codon:yes gene_type:complete